MISFDDWVASAFWPRVDKSGGDNACWPWSGYRIAKGYGKISTPRAWGLKNRVCYAHRVAYEIAHGKGPGDLVVMHSCDNPPCVNPKHLSAGSHKDNARDCIGKGRFRHTAHHGEKHGRAKATWSDVHAMREQWANGRRVVEIAAAFRLSEAQTRRIINGDGWKTPPPPRAYNPHAPELGGKRNT